MTGSFLDVDAPDTAWRAGSEDPIPVLLGRYGKTAFVYRFLTGRPLDGHARTNATFLHPGTKSLTRSGHTMPYNYWPGWKRGLLITRLPAFGLAPYTAGLAAAEHFANPDLVWYTPTGLWAIPLGWGGYGAVTYVRDFQHNRHYIKPIEAAVVATIRTRDSVKVNIPRGLVRGRDRDARGQIYLPTAWSGAEGDRDNLTNMVRERLAHEEADAQFNMEGTRPHMEIFTPPLPPDRIDWPTMMGFADPRSPYLGHSAAGPVNWDLADDSPHMGVVGGSGSGKSELAAWIVAQFMRAGAGVVVLDPKGTSHRWLLSIREVLYCGTPAMLHDTIMWLDMELDRRAAVNLSMSTDQDFPRLVVLLEERNSLQDKLRDHWADVRPAGAPQMSPAVRALDRLSSMGRTLNITVVLAAQETAQVAIGRKGNYGSWAIAGRLPQNHWKNIMGTGSKKPAISSKPGRFGYVVAGAARVFQAAYPDLKGNTQRLIDYATSGDALLDVKGLMQQQDTPGFPSSGAATSRGETVELTTLSNFAVQTGMGLAGVQARSTRDRANFPEAQGTGEKNAKLYRVMDLMTYFGVDGEAGDE